VPTPASCGQDRAVLPRSVRDKSLKFFSPNEPWCLIQIISERRCGIQVGGPGVRSTVILALDVPGHNSSTSPAPICSWSASIPISRPPGDDALPGSADRAAPRRLACLGIRPRRLRACSGRSARLCHRCGRDCLRAPPGCPTQLRRTKRPGEPRGMRLHSSRRCGDDVRKTGSSTLMHQITEGTAYTWRRRYRPC
jgi:hypothetical protein